MADERGERGSGRPRAALAIPDAMASALAVFPRLGEERVPLREALGRRLVRDFVARSPNPPFHASAMDGYAVLVADLASASPEAPVRLRAGGESRAGLVDGRALERGEARRIFTGAMVPPGAEAVVIQEDTSAEGDSVLVRASVRLHENVRRTGSDFEAGEVLVPTGRLVRPGEIAILASQDAAAVDVFRRPTVAILSTGDELREIGERAREGSIVGSNAWMLAALVEREGAIPHVLPPVADTPEAIVRALADALRCDVVLTTGGVSVGDHDHVPGALSRVGVEPVFAKVQMKPGKPVVVGRHGKTPVVGLPGNPASAMVGFELFVAPGLRFMQGADAPFPAGEELPLDTPYTRSPGRPEIARGRVLEDKPFRRVALAGTQRSGSLTSMLDVDALVLFSGERTEYPAGSSVFVVRVGGASALAVSPFEARAELRVTLRV